MTREARRAGIDRTHRLPVVRQCALLRVSRSSVYQRPAPLPRRDAELLLAIDKIHTARPFLGSRRIVDELEDEHLSVNRKAVQRLMRLADIEAIYQRPKTSRAGSGASHRVFPYLLAGVPISRPNQVWASDITFIPMPAGFAYLVAILDVFSRRVLSWRLSNTMEARSCVDALEEAISLYGVPEVFNTDQGSQFTSSEFRSVLEGHGLAISMDGRAATPGDPDHPTSTSSSASAVSGTVLNRCWLRCMNRSPSSPTLTSRRVAAASELRVIKRRCVRIMPVLSGEMAWSATWF